MWKMTWGGSGACKLAKQGIREIAPTAVPCMINYVGFVAFGLLQHKNQRRGDMSDLVFLRYGGDRFQESLSCGGFAESAKNFWKLTAPVNGVGWDE
jgi:hypothetical protein